MAVMTNVQAGEVTAIYSAEYHAHKSIFHADPDAPFMVLEWFCTLNQSWTASKHWLCNYISRFTVLQIFMHHLLLTSGML